jgi:hypothetical protein
VIRASCKAYRSSTANMTRRSKCPCREVPKGQAAQLNSQSAEPNVYTESIFATCPARPTSASQHNGLVLVGDKPRIKLAKAEERFWKIASRHQPGLEGDNALCPSKSTISVAPSWWDTFLGWGPKHRLEIVLNALRPGSSEETDPEAM